MKDCLVTKLKGVVENDGLPKLNTIYLDLVAPERRCSHGSIATNLWPQLQIYMNTGSVHIESEIDMYASTPGSNPVRSLDVNAGAVCTISFPLAASLPDTFVEKCLTISGDVYNIRNLFIKNAMNIFSFKNALANNLEALKFAGSLIVYGGGTDTIENISISPSVIILVLSDVRTYDISSLPNNVKYLSSPHVNVASVPNDDTKPSIQLDENTSQNTGIIGIGLRCEGDVKNLPINTKCVTEQASKFTGNIEEFVDKVRSERPEGVLAIVQNGYTQYNGLLLNGVNIANYVNQRVSYRDKGYVTIVWDSNSISISTANWSDSLKAAVDNSLIATPY